TPLVKKQILSEKEYRDYKEKYEDDFTAEMGAEAIKKLLAEINVEELAIQLREELQDAVGQNKVRITKRLEVVEAFRKISARSFLIASAPISAVKSSSYFSL